jgi:type II secretory pathway pseudopilin PulG
MKPRFSNQPTSALTKIEVVVIVAVIGFFVLLVLPAFMAANRGAKRINCVNNLKQIGLAHQLWISDLNNQYPLLAFAADSDGEKFIRNDSAYVSWQAMSNQLSTPKILICPADTKRTIATNFATGFGNANISYFLNSAATTNPPSVLDGDANLAVDGVPVQAGILNLWTNRSIAWTKDRHHSNGNIGLADSSVMQVTSNGLNSAFAERPATNRLFFP